MQGISERSPVLQRMLASIVAAACIAIALLAISAGPGAAQTIGGERECAPVIDITIIIWPDGEVWIIEEVVGEICSEVIDDPEPCDEGNGYEAGSLCPTSFADASGHSTLQRASMGGVSGHPVGWALSALMGLAAIGAAAFKGRAPWAHRHL